ncbi:bifunctional diaminohydroxyphosphoribosylaminopyrimidine deaminase/5-amino-6-(5-phosphoribosylamino)uracil reductase RibD [Acidipila rosea]|uniref:Riboflavin biosynthesis protein RibD n=1 Tax=Acidipila rosea TaxID=768535 RepID=A0A4R1LEW0_9BACT|nr:bifunctional diaminohydroxyphosphoribosylaminopyrimidine deaminase/5-amino-6-(5-phosphoribosylamino)uracil reductase RibD [Acidipila rosea]TCK75189.1 diaminohydroxyphosphoribosylaminopyrimidine deaminase [Acidipila rosea]
MTEKNFSAKSAADSEWMSRALSMARRASALATPNPTVGCVIVQGSRVVGEGFHEYDKLDHAEIVALKEAGGEAQGATAYVTLEPCSHQGRTPPCVDVLIAAGIRRVVAATADPNPVVNGNGLAKLRSAGIEVAVGVRQTEARDLNDGFARHIRSGLPFVTLKSAMSLDGRIAPAPAKVARTAPFYITSAESLETVQQMRHDSDAVITGINTALEDNPLLTDRTRLPRRRPLLRVVLDSALRLRLDSKLVRSVKDDVLVFCTTPIPERQRALEALGIRVERIDASIGNPRVSLKRAIERLGEMKMTRVMIEAGSQINNSAFATQAVDKLTLFYAPILLGARGIPFSSGTEQLAPVMLRTAIDQSGPDFRLDAYLRDPWQQEEDVHRTH